MVYILAVQKTETKEYIGFVRDALLNLSSNPNKAKQLHISSGFELIYQTGEYQKRLDMILDGDIDPGRPIAKLCEQVYKEHYSEYTLGQLRIVPRKIDDIF